jgi:hypothetical protein
VYEKYSHYTLPSAFLDINTQYDIDNPSDAVAYTQLWRTFFNNTLGNRFSADPSTLVDTATEIHSVNDMVGYITKVDKDGQSIDIFRKLIMSDILCSLSTIVKDGNSQISIDEIPGF